MRKLVACCAIAILVLLSLLEKKAVIAKDGCSKDWMRYMLLNACGMDKRQLHRGKFFPTNNLNSIIEEVMNEMDKRNQAETDDPVITTPVIKDKPNVPEPVDDCGDKPHISSRRTPTNFWERLIEHPVEALRITEEWLGLRGNHGDTTKKYPRRRAIQNMISRCCSDECSAEDFEGIC